MTKLLVALFALVVIAAIFIIGIGTYLSPDGLSHCDDFPSTKQDCGSVDAIVAISGGDTPARATWAIEMYKHGWAPLLVFSGAAADKSGPSNAEVMKQRAIAAGVPKTAILMDGTSATTKQNAANTTNIFVQHNIQSVILVTSAYHQRRAGLEFGKRAGGEIKIVNHPVQSDDQWNAWWWTTPTGWYLATSEIVKIIAFYAGASR